MTKLGTVNISLFCGVAALIVGLLAFSINWSVYGGGMPGYKVILLPGNLSLVYIWHPIFTEEIDFWPKLALHSFGQFGIVAVFSGIVTKLVKWVLQTRAQ